MLTCKAMTGAENYASRHLSHNDYYSKGERVTGQWMGHGAELLCLEGAVTMEAFDAIRQGLDPTSSEFLRQRLSVDKIREKEVNGETIKFVSSARNLYDFTVSAPKDISIQAMVDTRLIDAHSRAAAVMVAEMEGLAGTRVRMRGANEDRITSNLVISAWRHDTSRELDPQIHTHFVAANLTYDGVEGRWKALAATSIYQHREYLTEVYRNELADEVTRLGYQIENRFEHGKDNGFGLVGIAQETREKYSQRSAQRDDAISKFLDLNGRLPSNNEIAILVRETRDRNLAEISTPEVKARQLARMDASEVQTLNRLHKSAVERGAVQEQASATTSFAYAKEHVFERLSVARNYELQTEALRHGRGRIKLPELKAALLADVATGAMLTARGEVATKESLNREHHMVATINEGIGQYKPLGHSDFVVTDRARPEQRAADLAILQSTDLAYNLSGAAGTGKTGTLQEVQRGLTEARRSVVAVAPSAGAVQELQKVGFQDAMTIARLLADPKQQQELAGQVLIIDEAGMVSSKDMAALIDIAKTKGARILYSGDTAQIKSVSEGDALRVLENESDLRGISLLQVQRQINAEYRAAMQALRTNPAEAFTKLEAMGAIRKVDWRFRAQEVASAYRELSGMPNQKGEQSSVLVVARTHDEISSITYAIRSDRKRNGEIVNGQKFVKHTPLNWTEAQKKNMSRYQPGQTLVFHKQIKGVPKNEALEVISADKRGVTTRDAQGKTVHITGRQAKAFGVFEKQDIEVSARDKLLLQANWKEKSFKATNGELVTVAAVQPGAIKLDDGRQLPAGYRQFTHGYAVTANYSQGKTVDRVAVLDDGMARDKAYVAESRGRESLIILTSDVIALQESMGVSGDRQSAIELAKTATISAPRISLSEDDFRRAYEERQSALEVKQTPGIVQEQEIHHHVERHQHHISL